MRPERAREKAREILNRACVAGTSERYPDLESDLAKALLSAVLEEREACAKVVESGFLYGTDGKNDDFACSTCGGDIRAKCCIWAFNYEGNKEIAKEIRHRNKLQGEEV